MIVGYARTSTLEQEAGLEAQVRELNALGCGKLFQEQASSVGTRPVLEAALEFVREGDTLVVTKLDRLARSVTHLGTLVQALEAKGVALRILNLGIDTNNATGKLVLTIMGGIAEFERAMMLERQKEGIAKAKSEGRYKGRKPTARLKSDEITSLKANGHSLGDIARALSISKTSVHRILAKYA